MTKKKIILTVIALVAVIGAVLYADYLAHFQGRFLPGTRINDIKVQGEDRKSATADLQKDYTLTVTFRRNKTEQVKGEDIDFRLDTEGEVKKLLEQQNFGDYLRSFLAPLKYTMNPVPEYSSEKLEAIVTAWPEMNRETMEAPKNARVRYQDGEFFIAPETKGTLLRAGKVMEAVEKAVSGCEEELEIEAVESAYPEAKIKSDDKALADDLAAVKSMDWNTVTYKIPKGDPLVLDPNTTMKWLERDQKGRLRRSEERWNRKLRSFVRKLAENVDTVDKKHTFKTHAGKIIKLKPRGYYGWRIDREAEEARLTADLASDKPVTRKPRYIQKEAAPYRDNYGYGGTYVEVNLSAQHLWMYKKGKVVLESDVVSGTKGAHATPDGAYFVLDKARNVVLRGPQVKVKPKKDKDGKVIEAPAKPQYEWESPVSYWMPLTYEGVGMHDASWRGAFGGSIWFYNGSHGCINLPVPFAPRLFRQVKVGTPVAVYY